MVASLKEAVEWERSGGGSKKGHMREPCGDGMNGSVSGNINK